MPALQEAIDEVFDRRIGDVSGRGKLAADMREIWVMQPRFDKRVGSSPFGMVMQQRFRAGFDFLRLRADVGEVSDALAQWWQLFQVADDDEREALVEQARDEAREEQKARQRAATPSAKVAAKRPSRSAKSKASNSASDAPLFSDKVQSAAHANLSATELAHGGDAPPPKKRRRRRKPNAVTENATPQTQQEDGLRTGSPGDLTGEFKSNAKDVF